MSGWVTFCTKRGMETWSTNCIASCMGSPREIQGLGIHILDMWIATQSNAKDLQMHGETRCSQERLSRGVSALWTNARHADENGREDVDSGHRDATNTLSSQTLHSSNHGMIRNTMLQSREHEITPSEHSAFYSLLRIAPSRKSTRRCLRRS